MNGPARGLGARVATLRSQSWQRKTLAVEAALQLARARFDLFRRGQQGALEHVGHRTSEVDSGDDASDDPVVRDIGWAVEALARTLPIDTRCLVQAVAAARMLERRDLRWVLHVGLDRDDDRQLIAHAWVTSGRRLVVGGSSVGDFARLVAYSARRPA